VWLNAFYRRRCAPAFVAVDSQTGHRVRDIRLTNVRPDEPYDAAVLQAELAAFHLRGQPATLHSNAQGVNVRPRRGLPEPVSASRTSDGACGQSESGPARFNAM